MKLMDISKHVARPARIVSTVLILLIAVVILQAIIIETAMIWQTPSRKAPTKPKKLTEEEIHLEKIRKSAHKFLPDGTIHLVYDCSNAPAVYGIDNRYTGATIADGEQQEEIYDVNGTLLWSGLEKNRPYEYLSWTELSRSYREEFDERRMKQIQMITPEFSRPLEIPVRSQEKTEEIWRYEPGRDLFVGYRLDGGKIGYISSTGLTDSISQAKPFGRFKLFTAWCPMDSFSPTLLWQTRRHIYEINFEKRQVQLISESTEANIKQISLHKWRALRPQTPQDSKITYRPLIRCLTEDGKHHLIMQNPDQKVTVTVDDDWWSESILFTATTQGTFLYRRDTEKRLPKAYLKSPKLIDEWLTKFEGKPHKQWIELYRVDNQGNLNFLNRYDWTAPARPGRTVKASPPWIKVKRYACQFSSPLYDLAGYLLAAELRKHPYRSNRLISDFACIAAEIQPGNSVLNWLLGLAMAGFAFGHGWPRRTSRPKLIFWLLFIMAFNLAGLLTYLALNHTPIIKCPACGRRRGLGKVNCARCGAELPVPERGKLDLILTN
jgi:hypothetical protein